MKKIFFLLFVLQMECLYVTAQTLPATETSIPYTTDVQTLNGHDFEIETPVWIADFIQYQALNSYVLSSSDFHELRGGLPNCRINFSKNQMNRVAFLGGSITYNSGWRDSVCAYLKKRFTTATFDFIPAGVPSFGSVPDAFRLAKDVLSKGEIDLLFVEAAVNDYANGTSSEEQIMAMEGIVRHIRSVNPAVEIVLMHFADEGKIEKYNLGEVPQVIFNHEKVAIHYHVPSVNLAREVTERINKKEFSWEHDFIDLHPSPFGQGIYAKSIIALLDGIFSKPIKDGDPLVQYPLPEKLSPYAYHQGRFIAVEQAKKGRDWAILDHWNPDDGTGTREDFVHVPMLVSDHPGKAVKLKFKGNVIGIAVAAGKDAGVIEYRVDGKAWEKYDLFTPWSQSLHLPWFCTLENTLSDSQHVLEIRVSKDKNSKSVGHACRIRYFYVNS